MRKPLTIIIIIFSFTGLFAQPDSGFRLVKTIRADIVDFTVDNLDNIYIINSTDQLKKLNANGDSVAVYNNVTRFGKVSYIDVSNPMRVLLYYQDFSTIVILDRLLSTRNIIDLRKHDILEVQAVGLSYDNNIWVFDEVESKLKKINEEGELIFETADFRQLFDNAPLPQRIFDQDGFIYLYDTLRGTYIFDYYGASKGRINMIGWRNFKVAGKFLYGTRADSLYRHQPAVFLELRTRLPLSFQKAKAINFTANRAYALKEDELQVYLLQ